VLDPHGRLVRRLLGLIPEACADRVIYFNPGDLDWVPIWNPLRTAGRMDPGRVADELVGAFKSFVTGWGDRLEHLLRHALFGLLHVEGACLLDVANLLRRKSRESRLLRPQVIRNLRSEAARQFWMSDFDRYSNADLSPAQHKLSKLLMSGSVSLMLSQSDTSFDLFDVMNSCKVLLVDLSGIGPGVRDILGCFILSLLHLNALRRSSAEDAAPFHVYCDEAHHFVTDAIEDLIAETRKFNVSLTLAHQYLRQFALQKCDALTTVGSTVLFRLDMHDAQYLLKPAGIAMNDAIPRTIQQKIALFRSLFSGLTSVYGTYDPITGKVRQVKATVTDEIIRRHLIGRQPYGVYLLVGDRIRALAADFDDGDLNPPKSFVEHARSLGIAACIERSKCKGYHVWMFFDPRGVVASKARMVARHILEEVGCPNTEVFPKQDRLESSQSGNFINAPLFGRLVRSGRTVFVDPDDPRRALRDQWAFLSTIQRTPESVLDDIIELNDLTAQLPRQVTARQEPGPRQVSRGLPPCVRRILVEGVDIYQRVTCFRVAVALKLTGIPRDLATALLRAWAAGNRPANGKRRLTNREISDQVAGAYAKDYRSFGCEDPNIARFCDDRCPLARGRKP